MVISILVSVIINSRISTYLMCFISLVLTLSHPWPTRASYSWLLSPFVLTLDLRSIGVP